MYRKYHSLIITDVSYNYELMQLIEKQSVNGQCEPLYDFCFIDGAHTWEVDGCAFFLADKLLKPGGWMLFDDLTWTIGGSPEALRVYRDHKIEFPTQLLQTPHVTKIFRLLVNQHSGFEQFTITDDWGWARKKSLSGVGVSESANPIVELYRKPNVARRVLSKIKRQFFR